MKNVIIIIIFFISLRFSSLSALYWTRCSLNSSHARKKRCRVLFVLQRYTKFTSSTGTRIPLFAGKELLVFLMSIWPKSAKLQMPSVLSAIQVALIYLTAMNFDLAELKWCLSEAGRNLTEVPGPGVLQGESSGVRWGMDLRLLQQCLISVNLHYHPWNQTKWDGTLNQWNLIPLPTGFSPKPWRNYIFHLSFLLEIKPATGHQHLVNKNITRDIQLKKLLTLHKFLTPG